MKSNLFKSLLIVLALIVLGAGSAFAGGYNNHSTYSSRPTYGGTYHGGGYHHQPSYYHPHPGYGHPRPYYYGPPARYYNYHNNYYRGCDRNDGGYYFSGAYSEPGFGFIFGTRGSW